ncbi:MAG: rhomboid family intramembrane serine protease [Acidobacteriota bacterium]
MIPLKDDTPRFSTPYITYFLIALNTVIFLYEMLGFGPRARNQLMFEFGMVPARITGLAGGTHHISAGTALLPILTSMFLHASWLHLIGNMWVLWIFGDNIEDYLGHFLYIVLYLLSGLAAAIAHTLLNAGSAMPTVGASGAIAGVMGAYLVLYPRAKVLTLVPLIVIFTFWWLPAWIVLGYWFVIQFFSGAITAVAISSQTTGGIAFWAHVGGFVAGIVLIKVFPARVRRVRYGTW